MLFVYRVLYAFKGLTPILVEPFHFLFKFENKV